MKICTFIGHKNAPKELEPIIESALENLILNKNVLKFYVGTHGNFDFSVLSVLKRLKEKYKQIDYNVVLAYLPQEKEDYKDYTNTIYPDGLEFVPKRFAIDRRNKWMIEKSDYLVCYLRQNFSNTIKYKEYAQKKGKIIINL